MIVTLPAPNIQEAQGKVCGHKLTPTSREALKKLKELVPRLRDLGVTKVISSDLDAQSGEYLARKLHVPNEEWESLRRVNAGKWHGTPTSAFLELWESLPKAEVPVKGGDSKASFEKRVAHSKQRLVDVGNALVILDKGVFQAMFGTAAVQPYHIYEVERGS